MAAQQQATPAPVLDRVESKGSTLSPGSHNAEFKLQQPVEGEPTDAQVEVAGAAAPPAGPPAAVNGPPGASKPIIEMSRLRFWSVFASVMLAVFLFALDQLIVSTAIPKIVSQFNSLSEVAWLSNAFFATLCAFGLLYSQMLSCFPTKWVFLAAVFIFEVGSAVCGAAPSMDVLIFGRALAGLGAAGIFSAAFQTIVEITTLAERAFVTGLLGACFGVSSVLGPLVGGAFTDHVSWRWAFYINLPLGAVSFVMIAFLLEARPALGSQADARPAWLKFVQLDWVATALTMALTVIICLAFQYGGVSHAWNSATVVVLLVLIPVTAAIIIGWTLWLGPKRAMLPLRFFKRRTVATSALVAFAGWGTFMVAVQYLAVFYQAVNGRSATGSGVDLLSMICVQTVLIVASGKGVAKWGRYKPLILAGIPCTILASGLVHWAIKTAKPAPYLLGFQVFYGVGVAGFLQNIMLATQVEFRKEPQFISRAVGILNYCGFLGRIFGLSGSTAIFTNRLKTELAIHAPELPEALVPVVRESITSIRTLVPEGSRAGVIEAYRQAIAPAFLYALALGIVALAAAIFIPDRSTHEDEHERKAAAADVEKAAPVEA